jgi:hypothetical protein
MCVADIVCAGTKAEVNINGVLEFAQKQLEKLRKSDTVDAVFVTRKIDSMCVMVWYTSKLNEPCSKTYMLYPGWDSQTLKSPLGGEQGGYHG